MKARYSEILTRHGLPPEPPEEAAPAPLVNRIKRPLTSGPARSIWWFLYDRAGIRPPNHIDFNFPTTDQALDFAYRRELPSLPGIDHLLHSLGADTDWLETRPHCVYQDP